MSFAHNSTSCWTCVSSTGDTHGLILCGRFESNNNAYKCEASLITMRQHMALAMKTRKLALAVADPDSENQTVGRYFGGKHGLAKNRSAGQL